MAIVQRPVQPLPNGAAAVQPASWRLGSLWNGRSVAIVAAGVVACIVAAKIFSIIVGIVTIATGLFALYLGAMAFGYLPNNLRPSALIGRVFGQA